MSDLDKVVSLARDWRRRGYYQKAIDCLRGSSQVDVKNDLVVLQIGDNLLLQGCYRDALELIESHLAAIDYGNPDTSRARSVLCSLRMLRCILVCYVLGKFHANIAEATRIWEVEGGPNIEVEVERPWVRPSYDVIHNLESDMCLGDGGDVLLQAATSRRGHRPDRKISRTGRSNKTDSAKTFPRF